MTERIATPDVKLEPIPDYGDLMSIDEFVSCCESGCMMDYDGTGYYATSDQMTRVQVFPSEVSEGKIDERWSHVVWFNR